MSDEQTKTPDTEGVQPNQPTEGDKPLSLYDKTEAIVTRQEEANKKALEIMDRQEKLYANQRLGGTSGGRVEPKEPVKTSDDDYANKFMKGEADPLGDDGINL